MVSSYIRWSLTRDNCTGWQLTPGNINDRAPVPILAKHLFGKLFGNRGYVSKSLFEQLYHTLSVQHVTKLCRNRKNQIMAMSGKILLRKRAIIETIINKLKNISQIGFSRHRSSFNFLVNVLAGLIAYSHQPRKPALQFLSDSNAFVAYP